MAVGLTALFIALGGTSYAAVSLPKNSVGTKQIKSSAVTSTKVKNGSLLTKDFKAGQIPKGATGAKGDTGATGPAGAKGDTGAKGDPGVPPATEAWKDVTLEGAWLKYDSDYAVRYFKDLSGVVHLEGAIKSGTLGTTAFTLPVGYRPAQYQYFAPLSTGGSNNPVLSELYVDPDGTFTPVVGNNAYFSLDGVSFRAAP